MRKAGCVISTLQYLDWLALQLLPDTAETEWLDRHGEIWLVNADGSKGRKVATFASGGVSVHRIAAAVVPAGTQLGRKAVRPIRVGYETTAEITIGAVPTATPVRALDAGSHRQLTAGHVLWS